MMNYDDGRSVTSRSETSQSATYTQAKGSQGDPWYRNDPWLGGGGQFIPIPPEARPSELNSWDNWMGDSLRSQTERVQSIIMPQGIEPAPDIPAPTILSAMIPEWINLPTLSHVQGITEATAAPEVTQTVSSPLNRTDYIHVEPLHEEIVRDSLIALKKIPAGPPATFVANSTDAQIVDDFS